LLAKYNGITIDKMIDSIGYNRYLAAYDYLMQALVNAYNELTPADTLRKQLEEPVNILKGWDKTSGINSVATTLALEWGYRVMQKSLPPATPYKVSDQLSQLFFTLGVLSSRDLLNLMVETQKDLEQRFGTWKIIWGEVNRYQRTNDGKFNDSKPSKPVQLAAGTFGCLPSFSSRRFSNTNNRYGLSGNSFVACVEFGKKVKAKSVLTGGQSFDPQSKHYMDQSEMYIDGKFKDVLFYKEDVLKHIERQYHPGE
jgi:acyl-homoserine lactone acylase PvdQ